MMSENNVVSENKGILIPVGLLFITLLIVLFMPDGKNQKVDIVTQNGKIYSENAHKLIKVGRYDEALVHIKKALEISPAHPGWHFLTALIYFHKGSYDNAKEELALTTKYRPDDVESYFLSGLLSFRQYNDGDDRKNELLKDARTQFGMALKYEPEHLHTNFFLSKINMLDGRTEEAINNLLISRDHTKHTRHMNVGLSEKEEKRLSYMNYYYLGEAYLKNNELENAIKYMEVAVIGGAGAKENLELGKAYLKASNIEKGLLYAYRGAALFYQADRNIEKTAEILNFMKSVDPDSAYVAQIEEMMKEPPKEPNKKRRYY